MATFLEAKNEFDKKYSKTLVLERSIVPVDGKYLTGISLKNKKGEPNEEYYKWQFIFALTHSDLYSKNYLGAEIYFPKGNKSSAPIKIDACIFDDKQWVDFYEKWRKLKEDESNYCLGFYYDSERLYIFQRRNSLILRYDESKNQKGEKSSTTQLSLDLTDSYRYIPSFEALQKRVNTTLEIDRSKRTIDDLDLITGASSSQINHAVSNILITLDKVGLRNPRGYEILIEMLALKIFDEKRSEEYKKTTSSNKNLKFYQTEPEKAALSFFITDAEKQFFKLSDSDVQSFLDRIRQLYNDAAAKYNVILKSVDTATINWKDKSHVRAIGSVVENLQDYSFIKSSDTDLYQLVFYKFANEFKKAEKAQFITPLRIIDFLVKIVNPGMGETIIDPTVGIADFLSMSFVNAKGKLDDHNIF